MSLNRTKLKGEILKPKVHKKIIWMIELGATYCHSTHSTIIGSKGSLLVHPESAL